MPRPTTSTAPVDIAAVGAVVAEHQGTDHVEADDEIGNDLVARVQKPVDRRPGTGGKLHARIVALEAENG
jgi:hypothetical protein